MIESGITIIEIGVDNNDMIQVKFDLDAIDNPELAYMILSQVERLKQQIHYFIDAHEMVDEDTEDDEEQTGKEPWE